jgi:hypothetical protein
MRKLLQRYLNDDCIDIVEEHLTSMYHYEVILNIPKVNLLLTYYHTNPYKHLRSLLRYERRDTKHDYTCVVNIWRYIIYNSDTIYKIIGDRNWKKLKNSFHNAFENVKRYRLMKHYHEMIMFKPMLDN